MHGGTAQLAGQGLLRLSEPRTAGDRLQPHGWRHGVKSFRVISLRWYGNHHRQRSARQNGYSKLVRRHLRRRGGTSSTAVQYLYH
eukprot:6185187-Pleurochrysis_carterae.AAC.3